MPVYFIISLTCSYAIKVQSLRQLIEFVVETKSRRCGVYEVLFAGALYQSPDNGTIVDTHDKVALPVTGYLAAFELSWPHKNADQLGIC